ncbi:hypothetical protein H6G33_36410 [Calothrix sp. FACHB-1219]|uniref:hypothetical protein n=1 Tax=unclassified Calothrix TaxID=2619626 RepID=UPI0016860394|nr:MULTISPECIES: hypothetical protein [unclassified Calothrix]MBD2207796.1 hypothetical protein [Calothrix sp. FACHB-168]MBD2222416.1 hypothetical protein [Calothrix sp. FACHB-1219]
MPHAPAVVTPSILFGGEGVKGFESQGMVVMVVNYYIYSQRDYGVGAREECCVLVIG